MELFSFASLWLSFLDWINGVYEIFHLFVRISREMLTVVLRKQKDVMNKANSNIIRVES